MPLADLTYDLEIRAGGATFNSDGDAERDDDLGFKAGASYLINNQWSIRGEADFNMLAGYVFCTSSRTGTIVVAAYEKEDGKINITDYTILHESGPYELVVPQGHSQVLAFRAVTN